MKVDRVPEGASASKRLVVMSLPREAGSGLDVRVVQRRSLAVRLRNWGARLWNEACFGSLCALGDHRLAAECSRRR